MDTRMTYSTSQLDVTAQHWCLQDAILPVGSCGQLQSATRATGVSACGHHHHVEPGRRIVANTRLFGAGTVCVDGMAPRRTFPNLLDPSRIGGFIAGVFCFLSSITTQLLEVVLHERQKLRLDGS